MTAITSARGAAMVMLDSVWSAMAERTARSPDGTPRRPGGTASPGYQRSTNGRPVARKWPTLTHSVRPIRARADQRLVHVAEQHVARLGPPDRVQQRRAAALEPRGHRVVRQLRQRRRDVAAQHVDRRRPPPPWPRTPRRRARCGVPVAACAARRRRTRTCSRRSGPLRRRAPGGRAAGAAAHIRGQVDVAVRQVGRRRHRREDLARTARPRPPRSARAGSPPCSAHSRREKLAGLVEPPGGAQRDEPRGVPAPNRSAKMPCAGVGVVDEQQQVAQADQGVRAVGRARPARRCGRGRR